MKPYREMSPSSRRAFTLLEVLLVLAILVILGSFAGVFLRRARQQALNDIARTQISGFEDALDFYELNIGSFPTSSQGLAALIDPPSGLTDATRWQGPYLESKVLPADPWGNQYRYALEGTETYRIWSLGADGVDSTADDISSN